MTTFLLSAFAVLDLVVGLSLVRHSGGVERKRPEVVLLVGVMLVLAAGFLLLVVVVRLHSQPVLVHERVPAGAPALAWSSRSGQYRWT